MSDLLNGYGEIYNEEARDAAGNWMDFRNFIWDYSDEPDANKWAIFYPPQNATWVINLQVMIANLSVSDNIRIETHNHWAAGKVDAICVLATDEYGNSTPEFDLAYELMTSGECLDEVALNELLYETAVQDASMMLTTVYSRLIATAFVDENIGDFDFDERGYYRIFDSDVQAFAREVAMDILEEEVDLVISVVTDAVNTLRDTQFPVGSDDWVAIDNLRELADKLAKLEESK